MDEPHSRRTGRDTTVLAIVLVEEALHYLSEAQNYANLISTLYETNSQGIEKDLTLQNSIICCLKALGNLVEKAAKSLGKTNRDDLPLFWRNMIYLRNNLIHHCYSSSVPPACLENFKNICVRSNQITEYLTLCITAKNTKVNLGNKKFKVFIDFHALCKDLEKAFSKEGRNKVPQQFYTQVILDALKGINFLLENKGGVTEELIKELKTNKAIVYYALQNLLELIATTANPSPEFSVIEQSTRNLINSADPDTDNWLRDLGESRMNAMHQSILIPNRPMSTHLANMLRLREKILSNSSLADKLAAKPKGSISKELPANVKAPPAILSSPVSPEEPKLKPPILKSSFIEAATAPSPLTAKGEAKSKAPILASIFSKPTARMPSSNAPNLPGAKDDPPSALKPPGKHP